MENAVAAMGCDDFYSRDISGSEDVRERLAAGFRTHSQFTDALLCTNCATVTADWHLHLKYCPAQAVSLPVIKERLSDGIS